MITAQERKGGGDVDYFTRKSAEAIAERQKKLREKKRDGRRHNVMERRGEGRKVGVHRACSLRVKVEKLGHSKGRRGERRTSANGNAQESALDGRSKKKKKKGVAPSKGCSRGRKKREIVVSPRQRGIKRRSLYG